jgi:CrcB protein
VPPQWDVLGVIAAGGVVGALSRFAVSTTWPHAPAAFPWSTLMVNISGCLLIGVLMTIVLELTEPHRLVRPFLGVGVLGGYTTFSTASVELQRMLDAGRGAPALLYLAASLFGAVAAVWAGTVLARAGERVLSRRPGLGGDPAP